MASILTAMALCTACAPGEYELHACSKTSPTVCWPCSPGYFCVNGSQTKCLTGLWSPRGSDVCEGCGKCGIGSLQARVCDGVADTVCADCPAGFGCDGTERMEVCGEGWYSTVDGVCERCGPNRTTVAPGAVSLSECVCELGLDNVTDCRSCPVGWQFVAGACRQCPPGHGCDSEHNVWLCAVDTYSLDGACAACMDHAHSGLGSASDAECVCEDGFVKVAGRCEACKAGTVYEDGGCVLCPPGEYCLGKTHHEPCPNDMFASGGSAMCSQCRLNSECSGVCVSDANCSCVDGYIARGGECRRGPAGTWAERVDACSPCEPGFQCAGGPDVHVCEIGTYSPGNLSKCHGCQECGELTVGRCNATHDSLCERVTHPMAVIRVWQQFRTSVDGETFLMFGMVLASSVPKAQLVKVCDIKNCVRCFQGMCPAAGSAKGIYGPVYDLVMEIRTDVVKLSESIKSLSQTEYLRETARTTMAKLTDMPFNVYTKVEHQVVCPDDAAWNGRLCVYPTNRTWMGLAVVSVVLLGAGVVGLNRKRWPAWARMEAVKAATSVDGDEDYADENTPVVGH